MISVKLLRRQIADFTEMIHPDFEHAIFRVLRQGCEGQRHAPVVEDAAVGMVLAAGDEHPGA